MYTSDPKYTFKKTIDLILLRIKINYFFLFLNIPRNFDKKIFLFCVFTYYVSEKVNRVNIVIRGNLAFGSRFINETT